jgi:hypothetical protein
MARGLLYHGSMNTTLNKKLAEIAALIETQERIVDTYDGMLSYCNDGEGSENILPYLDRAEAEIARLNSEWNTLIIAAEVA